MAGNSPSDSAGTLYNHRYLLGLGATLLSLLTKSRFQPEFLFLSMGGLAIRFWAVGYLGDTKGRSRPEQIITGGPYRLIRHPLYLANGLIVLGLLLFLGVPSMIFTIIILGYLSIYTLFAGHEEKILIRYPDYPDYRKSVSPIIPRSIYKRPQGSFTVKKAMSDYPAVVAVILVIIVAYLTRGVW
ncbi:MAG TPA: hypothetical protein EYP58_05175 [bacterium (Candidatus Stahlbacteria)]|nr:hypothetical protein [Candidatus Stahlbacteria bacterium]